MRTALGRARGLVALLLLALSVAWVLLRRRSVAGSALPAVAGGRAGGSPPPAPRADASGTGAAPAVGAGAGAGDRVEGPDGQDAGQDEPVTDAAVTGAVTGGAVAGGRPEVSDDVLATDAGLTPASDAGVEAEGDTGTGEPAAGDVDATALLPEIEASEAPTTEIPAVRDAGAPADSVGAPDRAAVLDATALLPEIEASEAPTAEIPAVTAERPAAGEADDLRALRGIGPSMERLLHGLGITTYRQLALLEGDELERVRSALSDFRSRIEREDWVGQARELHRAKYGEAP